MNAHSEIKTDVATKSLKVDISELRAALAWVNKVRETWSRIPILSQNLFQVEDGQLTITATCLDREARQSLSCDTSDAWSFVMNGHRVMKVTAGLSGTVTIEHDIAKDLLTLTADGMSLAMNVMAPPEDWPTINKQKPLGGIEVGENVLLRALTLVKPCISTEETRYYLNGIYWTSHDGASRMVTTNGHRLARLDLEAPNPPFDVIFPRIGITPLSAMLTENGNQLAKITYRGADQTPTLLSIEMGDRELHCKLIDGTYPDYKRVIPSVDGEQAFDIIIPKSATQRLRLMAGPRDLGCKISPEKGTMTIGREDHDGKLSVTYAAKGKSEPDIGFNTLYLAQTTATMGNIRLRAKDKGAPALVTSEAHTDLIMVLMPMRV
ncbi:DNA polymerase III beta subunit-like protein [Phaeobacter piscinae]|uniref:DNA polymerase III subunit beta n=1 Tax=Phaeobacter piscinae TaxID=1580596 RepID=UPI000C9A5507|nr:DNA polymerase III subunit beta [Phaeobacter piscinae]AUR35811.1 DNA polymerase III beta subunit-like protein [Phaeobacter piscinae]